MKHEQLSPEDKEKWTQADPWLRAELSNDEVSTDEELSTHLIQEGPMSKEEAEYWVNKRMFFINNIVMDDGSVYHPPSKSNK